MVYYLVQLEFDAAKALVGFGTAVVAVKIANGDVMTGWGISPPGALQENVKKYVNGSNKYWQDLTLTSDRLAFVQSSQYSGIFMTKEKTLGTVQYTPQKRRPMPNF